MRVAWKFSGKLYFAHGKMSLSTQEADDNGQNVMMIRMDNARNMASILKTINFKDVSI